MQAVDAAAVDAAGVDAAEDPLALDPHWSCSVPLLSFQEALAASVFRSGLSREAWLKRLAAQLHRPALLPLLWLLPRRWKLAPAQLPPRLQSLATLLEESLLSPALLAAVVDDLPHLLPATAGAVNALSLWSRSSLQEGEQQLALPRDHVDLEALLADINTSPGTGPDTDTDPPGAAVTESDGLSGELIWRNNGLQHSQNAANRRANRLVAQLLNRLAANQISRSTLPSPTDGSAESSSTEPWCFEQACTGRQWLEQLQQRGWQLQARLRSSVASFGLGASLPDGQGGWRQVPIALPLRTGLLEASGTEAMALLPHTALELRLEQPQGALLLLQYYQGTEGLCGWEALNDLHRPWQNDRENGTVRYLGEPFEGESLLSLIDLSELMALVHNRLAARLGLRFGGYGSLGFCIDTTALLEQAMRGRCSLFPVLLSGIWRERLLAEASVIRHAQPASAPSNEALDRYRMALDTLPLDLSHHGSSRGEAWGRLQTCQPLSSPFQLVQQRRSESRHGS